MFWFRMNNIRDNRQASKDERFSETGREINKDIVAPKRLSQIPVVREDCQIIRTAFHRFKRAYCKTRSGLETVEWTEFVKHGVDL